MFKEFLNKNGPSSKIMAQNQNLSNFLTFVSKELDEARHNAGKQYCLDMISEYKS